MSAWSAFLPLVLIEAPDVPEVVATEMVRLATIEFCERSWVWQINHTPVSVVAGTATYNFAPPAGALVVEVMSARHNGEPLTPKSEAQLDTDTPGWRTQTGTPQYFTRADESTSITLVPTPGAALTSGLAMKVALKPTRASTSVDDRIFEQWGEAICCGARARLFAMPGKPWTAPAGLVALEQARFDAAVAKAKLKAQRGFTRMPLRTDSRFM